MAWIISEALMTAYESLHCSPEPVAGFLEGICSDGELFALSSESRTQQAYCLPDRMTDFSRLSRFGMTFAPLTEDRGKDLLTWYLGDFLAKTFRQPVEAQGLTVSGQDCGEKWPGLLARYDRDTFSWKTAQCSLLEGLDEFSETWPRSGMTRNGCAYLRQTVERSTKGIGYGLWPTPTCMVGAMHLESNAMQRNSMSLGSAVHLWETPTSRDWKGQTITKNHGEGFMDFLPNQVMWPTPQASDNRDRGNLSSQSVQRRIKIGKQVSLGQSVSTESGQLNPTWVEWLMGWPHEWTDLKPLGTARFHEWQQQHSFSLQDGSDE